MLRKKGKIINTGLLLVLPVYLFFLNNSMQSYHSHVFANGIVITHSHYSRECRENPGDTTQEKDDDQIIIFHGLTVIPGDNYEPKIYNSLQTEISTRIELPSQTILHTEITNTKKGRAPPIII
jgi:hypothetical protein